MSFGEREPLVMPTNVEAEQGLLGAILMDNRAYERVSDFLLPEHFSEPMHARLYEAAGKLIAAGRVANGVSLKNLFDQDKDGAGYLARLVTSVISVVNAADYGRTILECWRRREIVAIANEMTEAALSGREDAAESIVARAEEGLYALAEHGSRGGLVPASQALKEHVAAVSKAHKAAGRITGLINP